jgi:UDP-glucuronate 4-epimerase
MTPSLPVGRPVLVTGAAGFIGFHTARTLLEQGHPVVGLDNLNPYYDPRLKEARLALLQRHSAFRFHRTDLTDRDGVERLFREEGVGTVIHLGAQAGVRHSLTHPHSYVDSNITGTLNILEGCRHHGVEHLVYASTSSVYGLNRALPFREGGGANHPMTMYAATKKATEEMAHSYSHLFGLPTTGLRFFTVYGPWGRPDMALFLFTRAMLAGEPIRVFGHGEQARDFTYVDDIVAGILGAAANPPAPDSAWDPVHPDPASSSAPWRVLNIGATRKVPLLRYIELLEAELGVEAQKEFLPMQPGDVPETHADTARLAAVSGYAPSVPVEEGVRRFVAWYREYHGV